MAEEASRGLIHVYTGDGKGKTTAALGLAMRASGHLFASQHHPFDIVQISVGDSFSKPKEQLSQEAQETLAYAEREILSGNYDLVVLDEVFVAISRGLITIKQVLDLLDEKPSSVELILTGRRAPPEIVRRADLVTEMLLIKHPFTNGITARRGIEY